MEKYINRLQVRTINHIMKAAGLAEDEKEYISHFTNRKKQMIVELTRREADCLILLMSDQEPIKLQLKTIRQSDHEAAKIATENLLKELNIPVK